MGTTWCASSGAVAHVLLTTLGDECVVEGADGHHLQRVRRLRVGERVTAADGAGTWRLYRVDESERGRLRLVALAAPRVEPRLAPVLTVAFAIVKGRTGEDVVAGLTELGVDRVVPLLARRSVPRWEGDGARRGVERLRRAARAAAAQCRRARLPEIVDPRPPAALAGRIGLVLADRTGDPLPEPGPDGWTLVVGPEGGFEREEVVPFADAPRLGVGPHVLRAGTAAVACSAVLTIRRHPAP